MAAAQATAHLDRLEQLYFPDNGTVIDSPSLSIAHANISQLQFADEKLYATPPNVVQYFSKEVISISKLRDNLELGQKFLALLYSYRSVSRGIPQAQSQDQANRPEMYKLAYEVLKPEIRKIKDLFKYLDSCCTVIANALKGLAAEYKDGFASVEFLATLAESFNLIFVIDALKNSKASLNNDFSIYKSNGRIWSNLKNLVGDVEDETLENHNLYNFLGTQNIFAFELRKKLNAPSQGSKDVNFSHEEIIVDLVNHCATMFETGQFVKPEEKHVLLKAMAFGLFLLDDASIPANDERDLLKRKRIKLDRYGKIIKSNPVVPFFGDMTMTLNSFFIKTPKLSQQRWEFDGQDDTLKKKYNVVNQIDIIRSSYKNFVIDFKIITNMNKIMVQKNGSVGSNDVEENQKMYRILLDGLLLMSDLSSKILEQSAWKFANPTNNQLNSNCPADATLYEMAVRYNYSIEERFATTEIIGYIKSISGLLLSIDKTMAEAIYKHIYFSIQMFVKTTLKDIVQHVVKKKKPGVITILHHLFNIMSDNFSTDIIEEVSTGGTMSAKQRKDFSQLVTPRTVSISLSQLHYIRVLLDSLVNDKAKGMQGGFLKEKDFKDNHVNEINEFLKTSFFFYSMLNFDENVRVCSDLSELWYKEFYLELTKQIQFPIEHSLPWILADTVLESELPEMTEFLLYPFDIYNDAANKALHQLRSRFLFDEIEAEVNLCFDQFIFKISHKIYEDYKTKVANYLLDKNFKKDLESRLVVIDNRFDLIHKRYTAILKQKRYQLLGRSICIPKMVAHFCNQSLRQSVEIAITKFEASDLTGIVELEALLKCARQTHKLLSQFLVLDSFDDILEEINESINLMNYNSRIFSHVLQEVLSDFVPNFCYNSVTDRFVRTPLSISEENSYRAQFPSKVPFMHLFGSKNINQAHNEVFKLYKPFIGQPHFESLARVLGAKTMNLLVVELSKSIDLIIKYNITPYVKVLVKGLPVSSKLPPTEFGAKGCFDYFDAIMKPIYSYRDLKSGVFQVFRELGNSILFVVKMESAFKSVNTFQLIQTSTFIGKLSSLVESSVEQKYLIKNVMEESSNVLTLPNSYVNYKQRGESVDQLYKPVKPLNLIDPFLEEVYKFVQAYKNDWGTTTGPEDDILVEKSNEFYRLFSAILFSFTIPTPTENEFSNRQLFGDGFIWAGAAIIHLLKEDKRFATFDFIKFLVNIGDRNINAGESCGVVDIKKFFELAEFNHSVVVDALNYFDCIKKRKGK